MKVALSQSSSPIKVLCGQTRPLGGRRSRRGLLTVFFLRSMFNLRGRARGKHNGRQFTGAKSITATQPATADALTATRQITFCHGRIQKSCQILRLHERLLMPNGRKRQVVRTVSRPLRKCANRRGPSRPQEWRVQHP